MGIKSRRFACREVRVKRPIFLLLECLDLAVALNNEAQRDSLHPTCRQAATNFVPEQRRNLIADEAIEHAAGLLRVHQVAIDFVRMFEGIAYGALRDFIEGDAMD